MNAAASASAIPIPVLKYPKTARTNEVYKPNANSVPDSSETYTRPFATIGLSQWIEPIAPDQRVSPSRASSARTAPSAATNTRPLATAGDVPPAELFQADSRRVLPEVVTTRNDRTADTVPMKSHVTSCESFATAGWE